MTKDQALKALDDAFTAQVQHLFENMCTGRLLWDKSSGKTLDPNIAFSRGFTNAQVCYDEARKIIERMTPDQP